jgi:hypothetical protein
MSGSYDAAVIDKEKTASHTSPSGWIARVSASSPSS